MARPSVRGIRPGATARAALPRGGIVRFFGETIAELRKAVWPTRQEVVRLTYVVIIIAGILGFMLGALDFVFTQTVTRYLFR